MLEHDALLLRPGSAAGTRAILDVRGAALGFVCRQAASARPWWAWLAPPVLEVREQEDAPLVFTLRRGWGLTPRYLVGDAEGRRVGRVAGRAVLDWHGRLVARFIAAADGGTWRGPEGEELARLTGEDGGQRLTFAAAANDDPFLRMLLLAAALVVADR